MPLISNPLATKHQDIFAQFYFKFTCSCFLDGCMFNQADADAERSVVNSTTTLAVAFLHSADENLNIS